MEIIGNKTLFQFEHILFCFKTGTTLLVTRTSILFKLLMESVHWETRPETEKSKT